jgi:hypothetical protein
MLNMNTNTDFPGGHTSAPDEVEQLAALDFLSFTPEQSAQQADLAARLLHMACIGTPRLPDASPLTPRLLALQALMVAYTALGESTPDATRTASRLAFDMAQRLKQVSEERLRHDIDTALQAAGVSSTTH